MTTVITYGTFDLFHRGHQRLLERARALGDRLLVGVTTSNYDETRGKLNVSQTLPERVEAVRQTGLADEIIIEEYEGQKINDIQQYGVDIFAIGSDWLGKFDYLKDYCEVIYLDRTQGVSSTQLRNDSSGILRLGIIGAGRIATRFVTESKYVSGVNVEAVVSLHGERARAFAAKHEIQTAYETVDELLDQVDAVYIAAPHDTHYAYAEKALRKKIHVLCEKPLVLSKAEAETLFELARAQDVILLEAVKTAFSTGFQRMIAVARSGSIGKIRSVDATFTKLVASGREYDEGHGGSISELATYPLLAALKLLGDDYTRLDTVSLVPDGCAIDTFSQINLLYPEALATLRVGLGVKAEGDLMMAGTKGYVYVPAPWWLTEYFEVRFEDPHKTQKYFYKFEGDGLRYELAEFARLIKDKVGESYKLRARDSINLAAMIEAARANATILK
ncbi:MAG: Gfo/Idh/MocA family oxidoreductase [Coriobacteriales bacterium]|jgi:choline-phosphate cytidylyltransferase|nr:Gfo/Idh/MocA family oxidoreductase [Coriobacteriales bacterium]